MATPDGYYWTGWLQPANSTTLLAQWQTFVDGKVWFTVVSSGPEETETLREQKKENALRSLIENVKQKA